MQEKTTNWIMVSFPHDFDHHKADQLVHEAVMESGIAEVGIESIGDFDDDNPIFYLEFKTRGPGRDWIMNTLSRHAYVQGITGVSSIPPSPIRGDSTVPPPPAGPESIPPIRLDPPMPLHALFPPKIEEAEEVDTIPAHPRERFLPTETKGLDNRILATVGFFVTMEAASVGVLFLLKNSSIPDLPPEALLGTGVVSLIASCMFLYYFMTKD